jgi:hypothetical protein
MGDFEDKAEEGEEVGSGVVPWYYIFWVDVQSFIQLNLKLCLPSCTSKEKKHNFGE